MGLRTEVKNQAQEINDIQPKILLEKNLSDIYQVFIGKKINKSIFRVKGKDMVSFSKALGDINPKYVAVGIKEDGKPDYSTIKAHPSFPNCFTIDAAFDITGWRFPPKDGETEGNLLIPIPSKILHTSFAIDYTNAEKTIQHKQKLYTSGYCEEIHVKNNHLWITIHLNTRTKEDQLVVQSKVQFIVREGGFTL